MRVDEILQTKGSDVLTTTLHTPLHEVARVMTDHKIGVLVVMGENNAVLGVVSERDVVRACASWPAHLPELVAGQVYTANPVTCSPDDRVEDILETMKEKRFRHMPVINHGDLAGVLSIQDVFRALLNGASMKGRERLSAWAGML